MTAKNSTKLTALYGGPGIGSESSKNSGEIHIYGGTLDVSGGLYGAGIGGGRRGDGTVFLHGGHVKAIGGEGAPGIGGGKGGDGTVTICGGSVRAVRNWNASAAICAATVIFTWDDYNKTLSLEADSIGGNIVFQKSFLFENTKETARPDNIAGSHTLVPAMAMYFDANGGTGSMPYQAAARKEKVLMPECGFTPPAGKVFDHWESDGSVFRAYDSYTVINDRTFTAVWTNAQNLTFESVTVENPEGTITKTWGDAPFTNGLTGAQTEVTWMSADETVATVDGNGQVTLVGSGETRIIAQAADTDDYAGRLPAIR